MISELFTKHGISSELAAVASENFLGLLSGTLHDRVILDVSYSPKEKDFQARVLQAVKVTMHSLPLYSGQKNI